MLRHLNLKKRQEKSQIILVYGLNYSTPSQQKKFHIIMQIIFSTGPFEIPQGHLAQQAPKHAFGWSPGPYLSEIYSGIFGHPGTT
jgi:hypothetical protein